MTPDRIVVYGDFNCPWSYLASRRAEVLAAHGVEVDWRAVEHDPWRPRRFSDSSVRFACAREEMDRVVARLLPDERLPYSLAGFLPYTQAAVSAYAEAYAAGVASRVRHLVFEAFWSHGLDLGDANVLRTLLVDAVRSGSSPSEMLHEWGYAVDVTGGPITTTAWRLVRAWSADWRDTGKEVVPVLLAGDADPLFGVDAVEWLGAELLARGLDPNDVPPMSSPVGSAPRRDRPSMTWVSEFGGSWVRDHQRAHALRPSA